MNEMKVGYNCPADKLNIDSDIRILLITNRDSDNVGDQVIEACNVSLIKTAMKNLGFDEKHFIIESVALGIVSDKYCETDNMALLNNVYRKIRNCTFVLFGGHRYLIMLTSHFIKRRLQSST